MPSVILGTGDKNSFLGEGKTIFQPMAIVDTELGYLGRFRAAINAGMRIRGSTVDLHRTTPPASPRRRCSGGADITTGGSIEVRNEVIGGVGLSYGIVPQKFDMVAELYGNYGLDSWRTERDRRGAREDEAVRSRRSAASSCTWRATRSSSSARGCEGRRAATARPTPRAFIGFIFEPSIGDRDGDGFKDDVDKCPDDPEDFDDFEDEDGCPEPDNDKRRHPRRSTTSARTSPRTKTATRTRTAAPRAPTGDRDGDGILDDVDKCPDDPEDNDGFEDEDGCPDPDNDKDGILDVDDLCPNDPEDKDGFEDEDGCPDPDNDKDRILDVNDKCPNEPETYNGFEDEDGCPDKGRVDR